MSAPFPTPWSAKLEDRLMRDGVDVLDSEGDQVFYVACDDTHEIAGGVIVDCLSPQRKVMVRDLLQKVNAHDALLAACEAAEFWLLAEADSDEPGSTKPDDVLRVLAEAITQARRS